MEESKLKYVGELAVVFLLEILLLLFRVVQPVRFGSPIIRNLGNDILTFAVEALLVIIVIGHFIFRIDFKDLGIDAEKLKTNKLALILSSVYVIGVIVAAYLVAKFSKSISYNVLLGIVRAVVDLFLIAVVSELIYRGLVFYITRRLCDNAAVLTIASTVLYAVSTLPVLLINSDITTINQILINMLPALVLGIELSLLYYYTENLGLCIIFHGTFLTFSMIQEDYIAYAVAGIYAVITVVVLIVAIVNYYKNPAHTHKHRKPRIKTGTAGIKKDKDEKEVKVYGGTSNLVDKIVETKPEQVVDNIAELEPKQVADKMVEAEPKQVADKMIEAEPKQAANNIAELEPKQTADNIVETEATPAVSNVFKVKKKHKNKQEQTAKTSVDLRDMKIQKLTQAEDEVARQERELLMKKHEILVHKEEALIGGAHKYPASKYNFIETKSVLKDNADYIAHLEKSLGMFVGAYENKENTWPHIGILLFKGEERNAIVTNGLRHEILIRPEDPREYAHAEVMKYLDKDFSFYDDSLLSEKNKWLIDLLLKVAMQPYKQKETNTASPVYLHEAQSITVEDIAVEEYSKVVLIKEENALSTFDDDGEIVNIYCIEKLD